MGRPRRPATRKEASPLSYPLPFAFPLPAGAGPDFPEFIASDARVAALANDFFRRHFFAAPGPSAYTGDNQTDWREWNALCTAWVDTGAHHALGRDYNADLAHSLEQVEFDADGYVYTYPPTFPERNRIGWPFPDHRQSGGLLPAWTFAGGERHGWHLTTGRTLPGQAEGWALGAAGGEVEVASGPLAIPAGLMPFLALQFRCPAPLAGVCAWDGGHLSFTAPAGEAAARGGPVGPTTLFLPLWRHLDREATLHALRLRFYLPADGGLTLERVEPLFDTRHSTNNSHFVLAAARHALWGADRAFLVRNAERIRSALRFLQHDLGGDRLGLLELPWWGHDGLTGLGHGIGSNYWDLLPFGHREVYGTAYYLAALRAAAELEALLADHPGWGAGPGESARSLRAKARHVQATATAAFWDADRGRFIGTIDAEGTRHDHGFVFANLEALHLGLGGPPEAAAIYDWLDGRRLIAGDTAQGPDIYHWRFAPRATTRRNEDWYFWVWEGRRVPWGQQVQDGGAVLYTSYHDVCNRLAFQGADPAFARLARILDWYEEVWRAGGYRPYYAARAAAGPEGGSLQGAGTAGGLGIDAEFVESTMVPLVLLYGFLGVRAGARGLTVSPRLPAALDWLGVRHLRYAGGHYHLRATHASVTLQDADSGRSRTWRLGGRRPTLVVEAPWPR